jgi:hypothetical protein
MAARGCPGRLMRVLMELAGLTNKRIVEFLQKAHFLADGYLLGRVTSGNGLQMTRGGYHCHSYCVRHRRSIPVAWSNRSLDRYRSKVPY